MYLKILRPVFDEYKAGYTVVEKQNGRVQYYPYVIINKGNKNYSGDRHFTQHINTKPTWYSLDKNEAIKVAQLLLVTLFQTHLTVYDNNIVKQIDVNL